MKKLLQPSAIIVLISLVGCATTMPPSEIGTDQMTRFECTGAGFSARMSDDFQSVRLRTPEGSVNLDKSGDGRFKGDGWELKADNAMELHHKGKLVSSACKKVV